MGAYRPEYDAPAYRRRLAQLKRVYAVCQICHKARATGVDHDPPLSSARWGEWSGRLRDACLRCNLSQGNRHAKPWPTAGSRDW